MSARLIGDLKGQHDIHDDLESSIYVLLWMVLMFLECSGSKYIASFMAHVINLQPYGWNGGLGKIDFLQTQNYWCFFKFSQRPRLDTLLTELAHLYSVHYEEKPNERDEEQSAS